LVKEYTELFVKALRDSVDFASKFLYFKPFPYQEEFLRDDSSLIAACCPTEWQKARDDADWKRGW
jgi:hypothetical protein